MRLRLLAPIAATLLVAAAPSRSSRPVDPREAAVEELVLDNGLRAVLWPTDATPLVSVWMWYRVGSRHERPGASGLTHLLEHLTFRGTESLSPEAMTGMVDRRAGRWNGYTWLDQTAYFGTAPPEALPELLRMEAERMSKAALTVGDFEAERSAVMAELAASETDAAEVLHREVVAAAIRAHPYHWPTLGWSTDLAGVTREELVAHYQRHYHPGNATLVIVGDFDAKDARTLVEETLGAVAAREAPPARDTVEPPQKGERRVTLTGPGEARRLQVSWRAPAFGDPDFPAFLVADAVLSGAKGTNLWAMADHAAPRSSRLHRRLVATGLAREASSSLVPTADPYVASVRVTAADGADPAAVEAAVVAAAEGLATEVSASDVARAKAQLSARLVFESASVTDIGHQLGFFDVVAAGDGGWRAFFRLPRDVERVTLEDVKRVAARWLTPDARTVGWVLPPRPEPKDGPGGPAEAIAAPRLPKYRGSDVLGAARNAAKKPTAVGPDVRRSILKNGVVVLAARNDLAPELVVRLDAKAGSAWETADKAGLASLTARLLLAGAGERDEAAVAAAFDDVGATVDVSVDEERASLTVRMLARDAETLLPVLRDLVDSPVFPESALERERAQAIERAGDRGEDARAAAEATLRAALYPAVDARGRHPAGTAPTLRQITRADVVEFHARAWRPETTVIAVSGDLDPRDAVRLVRNTFGRWKAAGKKLTRKEPGSAAPASPGWIGRINLEGHPRADLVLGWEGPARSDSHWLALRAANTVLGEIGLGGRLSRTLREEKGLADYAWSSLEGGARPGPYLVRAGVTPDRAAEAIAAINEVLGEVAAAGLTEEELAAAKELLKGELALRFETNRSTAAYLTDLERWGLGDAHRTKIPAQVDALTREQVAAAAKAWIRTDGIAVIAGPR